MNNILKFIIVASGTAIGTGSNFFIQILLANKLTVNDYGVLTTILNVVNLLAPIVAFGVTNYLLKCYAEEGHETKKWYSSILVYNAISIFLCLFIFYFAIPNEMNFFIMMAFFIYMVSISLNNFTLLRFQIGDKFREYSFWVAFPNAIRFIILLIVGLVADYNLKNIGLSFSLGAILVVAYSMYSMFIMKNGNLNVKYAGNVVYYKEKNIIKLFEYTYPYGLAGMFYIFYYQIDIFILKYYVDYNVIANYSIALIFISAICLLPTIFYQQIFMPKIHHWAIVNKKYLATFYKKNIIYSLFFGILFYLIINFFILLILYVFFGNKYNSIAEFFYILSIIIPIKFLSQSAGAIMNIGNWIKIKIYIMGFATLLNLLLNILLIKRIGLYGAIYSTIATEIFLMVCFVVFLKFKLRDFYE